MKDPEFNAMELRRALMDVDRLCDTLVSNLANMKASEAKDYARDAISKVGAFARLSLTKATAVERYKAALEHSPPETDADR